METRNPNTLVWDHWHIEASSICALKCPRCPRAEVPDSLLNKSLDLNFFQNQIGSHIVKQIKKITFCGNDGDPIYCKNFLEICSWLKQENSNIQLVIITNGSYKTVDWWQKLASILTKNDEIHWSLDGWDHASNNLYRINSDWNSIIAGIEAFNLYNSVTYKVWASIAFRFNEEHLEKQENLAKKWNFDLYQLTKSTKFGSKYPDAYGTKDTLEPINTDLVAEGHRFERVTKQLSSKPRPGTELKEIFLHRAKNLYKEMNYSGLCLIGNKGVFLNSQGEFYPCCWTATRYQHNQHWHKKAQNNFNLHKVTFEQILNDTFWQQDFLKFDSLECRSKCTRSKLLDTTHSTEW